MKAAVPRKGAGQGNLRKAQFAARSTTSKNSVAESTLPFLDSFGGFSDSCLLNRKTRIWHSFILALEPYFLRSRYIAWFCFLKTCVRSDLRPRKTAKLQNPVYGDVVTHSAATHRRRRMGPMCSSRLSFLSAQATSEGPGCPRPYSGPHMPFSECCQQFCCRIHFFTVQISTARITFTPLRPLG